MSPHHIEHKMNTKGKNMETTKICNKCNIEKELSEFGNLSASKDGKNSICKECRNSLMRESRQDINSKHKEILRKSYKKHKEKRIQEKAEYRESNRKLLADKQKEYYRENKEDCIEYQKKYRVYNKEKVRDCQKRYRATETAKVANRNREHRRRSLKKEGDVSTVELRELLANAKVCYWCNKKLIGNKKQVDHYVALSKGGKHTLSNLVVACPDCNLKKNAKDPFEFALTKGRLL